MNKDQVIGFLACACLFLFMGASTQINNRFKDEQELFNEISNIYTTFQTRQFRVFTSSPTASQLREREVVLMDSAIKSIFVKIDGSTYSIALGGN